MQKINSQADQVTHVVAHGPCGAVPAVVEHVHDAAGLNLALGELPGQLAGDLVQLDLPVAPRKEAGHVGPLSILAGEEEAFAVDLEDADVQVRTAIQGISRVVEQIKTRCKRRASAAPVDEFHGILESRDIAMLLQVGCTLIEKAAVAGSRMQGGAIL